MTVYIYHLCQEEPAMKKLLSVLVSVFMLLSLLPAGGVPPVGSRNQ